MDTPLFTVLAQGGASASGSNGAAAPVTTTAAPGTPLPGATPQQAPGLGPLIPIMILMMVVFLFLPMLTNRKERKKRDAMMKAMKKGDKVLTIGGLIGTIDQVRDDEVILKVDPNSNAKIAFTKSAIQQVLNSGAGAGGGAGGAGDAQAAPTVEVKAKNGAIAAAR